jgi:HemY protein
VAKNPRDLESGLAIARAAIDAGNLTRARSALEPLTERPTRRVALLMAEIEHGENGDNARSRAWTLRAVRALHDPAWTADGYISDRWRPVSPVTGRLDAFHWQVPLSELPSNKAVVVEDAFKDSLIAPPDNADDEAEQVIVVTPAADVPESKPAFAPPATPAAETVIAMPAPAPAPTATPPMFHRRPAAASPVIPIVRAPDDPGIDEEVAHDDFAGDTAAGGGANWRGRQPPR